MTLPYDYARCAGTTHPTCQWCRRREPGRERWQSYIAPPIDTLTGECSSFIEPPPTRLSNNTTPNTAAYTAKAQSANRKTGTGEASGRCRPSPTAGHTLRFSRLR